MIINKLIYKIKRVLSPQKNIKFFNVIFAMLYILVYRSIYKDYLAVDWDYFGYSVNNESQIEIWIANSLCIIPILFYKAKRCLSDFIAVLLYLMANVPIIIALQYYYSNFGGIVYELVFTISMIVFFLASSDKKSYNSIKYKQHIIPSKFWIGLCIFSCLFVVLAYGSTLNFASFEKVYDQRASVDVVASNYPILGYLPTWAAYFLGPLVLSLGLHKHKPYLIALGVFTLVLMYMALALKAVIIIPIMVVGFYYIFANEKVKSIVYLFPFLVILISILTLYLFNSKSDSVFALALGAVFFLRTIGISSMLAPAYIDVFTTNQYTFFSHIRIVNLFTGMYPFKNPDLGVAVWNIYSGSSDSMNANANFLITDGIASFGVVGVIIITIVFYYILVYLNRLSYKCNANFVLCAFTGISLALMNVSLFTTLLTGGMLLGIIALRFTDFDI